MVIWHQAGQQKLDVNIRIGRSAVHRARVDVVSAEKALGQWLEEPIAERRARYITRGALASLDFFVSDFRACLAKEGALACEASALTN